MQLQNEQQFVERWPNWFTIHSDVRHMRVPLSLELEDGWFDLLWRLCTDLEPLVSLLETETGRPFGVFQVKERFGELHFYANQVTAPISKRIEIAEQEAARTCELCGQPGSRQESARIRITCREHAD